MIEQCRVRVSWFVYAVLLWALIFLSVRIISGSEKPKPESVSLAETSATVKGVTEHDVVPIQAGLRYETAVVFPSGSQILEISGGDFSCDTKTMPPWVVCGRGTNILHVKPTSRAAETDANVLLKRKSGDEKFYTFALVRVKSGRISPKVFIEPEAGDTMPSKTPETVCDPQPLNEAIRRYHEQQALASSKTVELSAAQRELSQKVDPASFVSDYHFKHRGKEPFKVMAIYRSDKFTFIKCEAQEKPAIYEEKDGKPNLVTYSFRDGLYTVNTVIDKGYMQIGKKKLEFKRGS
jgi:type IV secretion system protein VirB9